MKNSLMRRIVIFITGTLLVFSLILISIIYYINQNAERKDAETLLGVFEAQIKNGGYTTEDEFKVLVKINNVENLRITVIDLDGTVLADSEYESTVGLENHLNRKEVRIALQEDGKIGSDIRESDTVGIDFLYVAKKTTAQNKDSEDSRTVILRIAVPITSINAYVYATLGAMAGVLLVIVIISFVLSGFFARTMIVPFGLIKKKLNQLLAPDEQPETISLTKYDDINCILTEIDEISEKLNSNLIEFQSEQQKLHFIIENINQGVIALNSEKEIILCNNKAKEFVKSQTDILAPIFKMVRNKSLLKAVNEAIATQQNVVFDIEETDGKILNYGLFPIASEHICLIIVIQDMTDMRKLALEKQEFFENAGHELKTPLSSILGYSEMLLNKEEYNRVFVETINKEALRMKNLISDMLKISELEESIRISNEVIDLKNIINQVILSYTPKAENKGITILRELESSNICANIEKITEVVANIIDNAIKYCDNGGQIRISLKTENGKAVFSVADNGIGIESKNIKRIFERFYRIEKGQSRGEGTGLGLAIVKHICNHYKAPISVKSKIGEGTKITISFIAFNN